MNKSSQSIDNGVIDEGGILLLSNNQNAVILYDWLIEVGEQVCLFSEKLTEEYLNQIKPSFIISYNYSKIIPERIIKLVENKIINMHISYLPWNKGSDPNFWSFIDDTPKGVTIHRLTGGLDRGDILLQKRLYFDEKVETFKSTYEKLNYEIVKLLQEHWVDLKNNSIEARPQCGKGSYHKRCDTERYMNGASIDWNEIIYEFKKRKHI